MTWGHAGSGHSEFVRYGLRVFLKNRLSIIKELVVFILDSDRAVLRANAASSAFFKVNEVRFDGKFRIEITGLTR